ncbi:phage baseplate plug family protein [Commensalibacter oyaizuii]|uniref:Cyanophage baseplate Pam3 plug gp18 domain-containing protein n=1 Tax=Commensalibacter oyaizuii TaxID=3043873 RepID=A0ABT6Q3M3_9PROT|nr:hypothetical protein [Commensalibacter sp. TBRC 16381]MDI2091692.1 hypothetical protein [Commensalibacter sp. TBRC 16381]
MQLISINAVEAQQFSLSFREYSYRFRLLDRGKAGVFLDVYQGINPVLTGLLCLDRVRIIRSAYVRFPGDFMFVDQEGFDNPSYTGFNNRFLLYFLEEDADDKIGL